MTPILFGILLFLVGTAFGILPVKKLIQIYEAKHELKRGSTGFLITVSGWAFIAFWIMAVWFIATILGDWSVYGDLPAALDRAMLRLRILLEIAAALADD